MGKLSYQYRMCSKSPLRSACKCVIITNLQYYNIKKMPTIKLSCENNHNVIENSIIVATLVEELADYGKGKPDLNSSNIYYHNITCSLRFHAKTNILAHQYLLSAFVLFMNNSVIYYTYKTDCTSLAPGYKAETQN